MRLVRVSLDSNQARIPPVLTVGTFDGLHVGHRALMARAVDSARAAGSTAGMVSFEPMPREFLQPEDPPPRLTNFRERWRLLAQSGLDALCLLHFTRRLQRLDGEQFLELLRVRGARRLIVGHDFRFGYGGRAGADWLQKHGHDLGIEVEIVPPVQVAGERVSSGAVRLALQAGDFQRATQGLGRPYTMRGRVRRGQQLGRTLGFPTANLALHRRRAALAGIFAVRVGGLEGEGGRARADRLARAGWPAVASLGTRPTVHGVEPLLEVHLFDFADDLYGHELEVEFVGKLREERRFEALDAMVEQMRQDAAEARRMLGP